MIITNKAQTQVHLDALTVTGEIEILQGNTDQTVDLGGNYQDDRTLVPLVLFGHVDAHDNEGMVSGEQELLRIDWYEGNYVKGDSTNLITDSATGPYRISDGSSSWCSGLPKWALIVKKNLTADSSSMITGVMYFSDRRTGTTVAVTGSELLTCSYHDMMTVTLESDRPEVWIVNPLALTEGIDSPWLQTVTTQLRNFTTDIDDSLVCYEWLTSTTDSKGVETWRAFDEEELELLVHSDPHSKTLTIDARMIDDELRLRCYAALRNPGEAWSSPYNTDNAYVAHRVAVRMSPNLHAQTRITKGFRQATGMDKEARYVLELSEGGKAIASDKEELFTPQWVGTNNANGTDKQLGGGMTLEIVPKSSGFSTRYGAGIHAEVGVYDGCAVVVDDNGKIVTNDSGSDVIAATYD